MIVATAALMTALAVQQPAEPRARAPQTDQTVPVTRGARLTVDNFAGEVNIRTWDKDSLRVQAHHSARVRVNIKTTAGSVGISSSGSAGPPSVDYTITAPAWMPVRVDGTYIFVSIEGAQSEVAAETVRGDIVVKGGTGSVSAKSVEGEVIVDGARGKVTAHSVNEGIKITNTNGDISAETVNGAVTLTGIQANSVEVATVNGNITYDGVALDNGSYRFTTHNGSITIGVPEGSNATFTVRTYQGRFSPTLPVKGVGEPRRGQRAMYTLGTGSANVEMESFNGTIRLRRAEGAPPGRRD
jgi:Putative adhesin